MKKVTSFLFILLLLSCSADESSYNFNAIVNTSKVTVDQTFSITVSSEENIIGVRYSYDNFKSDLGVFSDIGYGTSKKLYFKFLTIGKKTIYIKLIKAGNIESETKTINIDVERGNSVRITGLKITSFDGINSVWDPEYDKTNSNSLADVRFSFSKNGLYNAFEEQGTVQQFYLTSIKENQGDLTWSFLQEELYINPEGYIIFSIYDQDESNIIQLLDNSINVPHIYMKNYEATKPSEIKVTFPESSTIEFTLYLEWPK